MAEAMTIAQPVTMADGEVMALLSLRVGLGAGDRSERKEPGASSINALHMILINQAKAVRNRQSALGHLRSIWDLRERGLGRVGWIDRLPGRRGGDVNP